MIQIIVLIVLIALNAYFASAEIAFISLNDAKIEKEAKEGNKKAKQIYKMVKEPSKFLATIQIGITLAGFLSSAFASETFASELAPILNNLIPLGIGVWNSISIVLITIILSYFTLVFGELVPKRIAMKNYEKIAYGTVGVIRVIAIITSPFVKLLTASTNLISKIFGVSTEDEETVTEEEIRMMVDVGEEKGTIEEEEKELINNVFEFNDKVVSEVMIHRTEIFAVDIKSNVSDILEEIDEFKYSRIPVYEETIDDIKGILYTKDIIKFLKKQKDGKVKNIMRDAYFVSENKPIDDLFRDLQKNKKQIAIVVDEYGGTAGVVTMEDILEEIVGDIYDEYDPVEEKYEKIDENTYIVDGQMSILDFEKLIGVKNIKTEYDTVSGYLMELMDRVPTEEENHVIETDKLVFKIEEFDDRRISKVKVCKINIPKPEDEQEDED